MQRSCCEKSARPGVQDCSAGGRIRLGSGAVWVVRGLTCLERFGPLDCVCEAGAA